MNCWCFVFVLAEVPPARPSALIYADCRGGHQSHTAAGDSLSLCVRVLCRCQVPNLARSPDAILSRAGTYRRRSCRSVAASHWAAILIHVCYQHLDGTRHTKEKAMCCQRRNFLALSHMHNAQQRWLLGFSMTSLTIPGLQYYMCVCALFAFFSYLVSLFS